MADVIVGIDASLIHRTQDLHLALDDKRPGQTVTVHVKREQERRSIPLALGDNIEE